MKHALTSLGILACLVFSACNKENPATHPDDPQIEQIVLTKAERGYVDNNNSFAWRLFADLNRTEKGSFVISPLSATLTLAMIDNGASGKTRDEINRLLGYGEVGIDPLNEFCLKMMKWTLLSDQRVEMALANAAAINKGYPLKHSFMDCLQKYYLAETFNPDFSDPQALALINEWCVRHTHGMIPEIIDAFAPNAQACFLNAVYFRSPWVFKFDPKETRTEPFMDYTGTAEIGTVDMMHLVADLEFFEEKTYTALELNLGSKVFRMTLYLPREGKTVYDVLTALMSETGFQTSLVRRLRPVDVKLPRFETGSALELNNTLKRLGMPTAFSSEGGFLNMTDSPDLYLGLVKQNASITVNEQGAEAAAVTIGEMVEKGGPELSFHANRPFLYTIHDTSTGAVTFMGRFNGK